MLNLQEKIDIIMSILPPKIDLTSGYSKYLNCKEAIDIPTLAVVLAGMNPYIQHIPEKVEEAQSKFLNICRENIKHGFFNSEKIHRQGPIGRIIEGNDVLYKCWNRFMCIDEIYREWTQPYFAFNFQKYTDKNSICVNKYYPEIVIFYRNSKLESILNENNNLEIKM